jgi:hypothetical protein
MQPIEVNSCGECPFKRYRTLLRVQKVLEDSYLVVIPATGPQPFEIRKEIFPFTLTQGQRLHAMANIDAELVDELFLSDFELKNEM